MNEQDYFDLMSSVFVVNKYLESPECILSDFHRDRMKKLLSLIYQDCQRNVNFIF